MRKPSPKRVGMWLPLLLLVGCATVPLPAEVRIVPPSPDVPKESAAFSGKWQGVWDQTLDHILVVEVIKGNEASVIYAWGDSAAWRMRAGFNRLKGTFEGGTLVVKSARPATVTYRMRPDGKLDALYEWQGGTARAVMSRVVEGK